MLFTHLFQKKQPRAFKFTPYYYDDREDKQADDTGQSRLHFRRITPRPGSSAKRNVRAKIIFAVMLVVFLYYFRGLVEVELKNFKIEDIRIEETPSIQ